MKDNYHQSLLTPLKIKQNFDQFTNNFIKNDDLQPLSFEELQNVNGIGNLNEKSVQRGKKNCKFCNNCNYFIC